jgi:5-methyltetrahydrofolate--homocysteine methyltransferase
MSDYKDLEEAVLNGQDEEAPLLVSKLISNKYNLDQIKESISTGILKAGENWTNGSYSSANILLSIDAYREAKKALALSEISPNNKPLGRIVITTIAGNVHVIGKALIGALLEATGFEVIDLGENIARNTIKEKVIELKPDILALGCYTLSGQQELKKLIVELDSLALTNSMKIIIGGHSTSQSLADQVGADAWASNLPGTVEKAKMLIRKK